MTDITLQTLLDRAALSDVFHNYASGVDMRDWVLFRSLFTDDVHADFSSMTPGFIVDGADKWTGNVARSIDALDATQHIITNHVHVIEGDRSKSRSYLQGQHVLRGAAGAPDIHYMIGGYYLYDMVRAGAAWKIKNYSLTLTWQTGEPEIFRMGLARKKSG